MIKSESKGTVRKRLKHSKDVYGSNLEDKIKYMMEQHETNDIKEKLLLINNWANPTFRKDGGN